MSKKKPKKRNKKYKGSANKEIKNNPSPFFNKHAVVGKVSSSKASQMGRRRKV